MEPIAEKIIAFLREIGLRVETGDLPEPTILPGITIRHGVLIVDEHRLCYPGDLLHEAGHLAVVSPDRRRTLDQEVGHEPAEEMTAIAWSYAAALHLQIDPAVVFHPDGYRGGSDSLLENFAAGRYVGVPMLQWAGIACEPKRAQELGVAPYPHMLQWLRTK